MIVIFVVLLFLLILIGGVIYLQIFLSKASNKFLGLIIPIIFLLISLLTVSLVTTAGYTYKTTTETTDGIVISEEINKSESEKPSLIVSFVVILLYFLILNIPTLIMLAIYFACREKINIKYQLDKMSIQDLE